MSGSNVGKKTGFVRNGPKPKRPPPFDLRLAFKAAHSFHRSTGIDFDDLAQEASLALYRASLDYNPCQSAFTTFAGYCVNRHLCTEVGNIKRKTRAYEELPEDLASNQASAEDHLIFKELLDELPEDARIVADLVLGEASALAGMSSFRVKMHTRKALGWPIERAQVAFDQISLWLSNAKHS